MIAISGAILCAGNLTQDILTCPVDGITFNATTWVEHIETSIGGNGANTAYTLAKLGARIRLAGAAGDDPVGDQVVSTLASAGVDIAHIERVGTATSTTVVLVNREGARAFLHRPGASRNAFTSRFDFSGGCVQDCSHFHLANPFALPALRERAGEMLRDARAAGLTTSLDTGWDARGEWMKVLDPCLPYIDLLFANDAEAEKLAGTPDIGGAARCFRERGAGAVVLKLGGQGCIVFDGKDEIRSPALAVEVLDTTGAGDCFVGGFLAALQRGAGASEAARMGNIAGALSVQRLGSVAGLLNYQEAVRWADSHQG